MYEESMMVPSRFFEALETFKYDPAWEEAARRKAGTGYTLVRWSLWIQMNPVMGTLRDQGFKLHISPDFTQLEAQVDAALDVLIEHRVAFKFVADRELLSFSNGKNFPRAASGKFFTVYPDCEESFMRLAEALSQRLAEFQGPYILTDRRVPGSYCVGYRYGGHRSISVPDGDGGMHMLIPGPGGELIDDIREPRFVLPDDIADPFGHVDDPAPSSILLRGGRYRIVTALYFSNSGGVYKATDTQTGETVVLKEARLHAGVRDGSNAQNALRHEFDVLKALESTGFTPKAFDLFEEWESLFLAQEYLPLTTWHNTFVLERFFLGPFLPGLSKVEEFLRAITPLARSAIEGLKSIHSAGFVLGDVSSNNIMVDADKGIVRFIDLESAIHEGAEASWQGWWNTPGFARPERGKDVAIVRQDDWFGLAMCLISAVMNFGDLPRLGGMTTLQLVETIENFAGLPAAYGDAIAALLDARPEEAIALLDTLSGTFDTRPRNIYCESGRLVRPVRRTAGPIGADGLSHDQWVDRICDFIDVSYRGDRAREFWPADPAIYASNKLCLAYGATGIAELLISKGRSLPASLQSKLGSYEPSPGIDPGLFSGLMGVAYFDARRSNGVLSDRLLSDIAENPLRYTSTGVRCGEAGIGIGALSIHALTGHAQALQIADQAASYLKACAIQQGEGRCVWKLTTRAKNIHYGFLTGVAGIAFFLAQYGIARGDDEASKLARAGMEYVLSKSGTDGRGNLNWGKHAKDGRYLPYAASGSAGIASILARLGRQWGDDYYVGLAERLVHSAYHRLAACVGQFDGLAGIAELMSDLRGLQINAGYHHKLATDVIDGIRRYAVRDKQGIAFPGWLSLRLSCDYASGSAGIGAAIARAQDGGAREFFDFWLPSRELFKSVVIAPARVA